MLMRVYGPEGGDLSNFRFDGEPVEVETVMDRGRSACGPAHRVCYRSRHVRDSEG